MHGNDPVQGEGRITWWRCVFISLAACAVSAVLGFWRPIWITPPYFRYTVILYVALAWTGIVVLAFAVRYHPVGKAWVIVLGIILNAGFSLVASVFIVFLFLFEPTDCSPVSTESIFLRYSCSYQFYYRSYTFTFDSLPYFPLMLQTGSSSSVSGFS